MAPCISSSTLDSSGSLAPLLQNGMNLPISNASSLNLKLKSSHDGIKSSHVPVQLSTAAAQVSSEGACRSIGAALPDDEDANDSAPSGASAPTKKLFLSRKRRMNEDLSSQDDSKCTRIEPPANETPPQTFQSALNIVSASTCNRQQHHPGLLAVNDGSLSAGAVASALCAIKTRAPPPSQEPKAVVTPDTRLQCSSPTIRPLETDFCFGPGTSRNPGNKALKHIAYYTTVPFLKENARAVANENIVIAKKVIEVWTSTGGRFLTSDDKSALWLPVQDDDFILAKIQRSIGSWKGAWRHELKE